MNIRTEREKGRDAVFTINASAFEMPAEAELVDALRVLAKPVVSRG